MVTVVRVRRTECRKTRTGQHTHPRPPPTITKRKSKGGKKTEGIITATSTPASSRHSRSLGMNRQQRKRQKAPLQTACFPIRLFYFLR